MTVIEQEQTRPGLVKRLVTRRAGSRDRRRAEIMDRNARWIDEMHEIPTLREQRAALQERQAE